MNSEASLPAARWSDRPQYTVLDADFQTGLRFLWLWHAWRNDARRPGRLHVLGVLPCLPTAAKLSQQLAHQLTQQAPADLQPLADELAAAWPLNLPGLHRLDFEQGAVTLTLGVGAQETVLSRLSARVDFSYTQDNCAVAVQDQIARLTRQQAMPSSLWDQYAAPDQRQALVLGAGFAGMGVAHALALRGWSVTVVDKNSGDGHDPLAGQSSATHARHASAALTPMVARDDNLRARLSRAGSLRAQARWGHVPEAALKRCGALQLQRDQGRVVDLAAVMDSLRFAPEFARYVQAQEASELAGIPLSRGGIYFPTAAQVNPQRLLEALALTPGVRTLRGEVARLHRQSEQWQALDAQGGVLAQAPYVIVASALDSFNILDRSDVLPEGSRLSRMHALAGEITFVPEADLGGGPRRIVSGDGYVLPAQDGVCVTGSSYAHGAREAVTTAAGAAGNLGRAAGLLNQPGLPDRLAGQAMSGWAGWRAVLPGRLPMIGPVPGTHGLWVSCGFASRGLTWAPLAGDLIAAALNAEPLPLENDIIDAISAI